MTAPAAKASAKLYGEFEFEQMMELLNAQRIRFTPIRYGSSFLPLPGESVLFGEISVSIEDKEVFINCLREMNDATSIVEITVEPIEASPATPLKRKRIFGRIAVTILVLWAIAASLAWYKNDAILRYNQYSKNFAYVWGWKNDKLYLIHKDLNFTTAIYTDGNRDGNFEMTEQFAQRSKTKTVSMDADEDGFYENITVYLADGRMIQRSLDRRNVGEMDWVEVVLDNGDTLEYAYPDNAEFATMKIRRKR